MVAIQVKEHADLGIKDTPREIVFKTRGHGHGPITRLMSPSDLGELIKPFVFLDLAEFDGRRAVMRLEDGWHPHSGIATVTVLLEGGIEFAETTGRRGSLGAGGVEFMRAGGGVWHTGKPVGKARAFQLWVALPPELESGQNLSNYAEAEDVSELFVDGARVRVILGEYGGKKSKLDAPPMTYLHVQLKAGERFRYQPQDGHDVLWLAVDRGGLRTPHPVSQGEIAVFEESDQTVDLVADGDTSFVIGSATKHPHDLVLGSYSVHTTVDALRRGQEEIRRIGRQLRAEGILG